MSVHLHDKILKKTNSVILCQITCVNLRGSEFIHPHKNSLGPVGKSGLEKLLLRTSLVADILMSNAIKLVHF